jgi:5'-3' exonuclease
MKKVFLVDSNNLLKRAFHGAKDLESEYFKVKGIYFFFSILRKHVINHKPDNIVFFWDGIDAGYHKHLVYENYKKNRSGKSWSDGIIDDKKKFEKETISFQKEKIEEYISLMGLNSYSHDKIESDDLICKYIQENPNNYNIVISSDRDLIQLIDDKTSLLFLDKEQELYTYEAHMNLKGYEPFNNPIVKSFIGDTSDNISKVYGFTLDKVKNLFDLTKRIERDEFANKVENFPYLSRYKDGLIKKYDIVNLYSFLGFEGLKLEHCLKKGEKNVSSLRNNIVKDGVNSCIWKKNGYHDIEGFIKEFVEIKTVSSNINVVNVRYHKEDIEKDVYIGRGSPLGNPYSHKPNTKANEVVSTREEAIEKYEIHIRQKLHDKDENVRNEMNKIFKMVKNGGVNLCCYCKPKSCHGDIIKKIIEEKF